MPKLHVIVASTRPGRVGIKVGNWFAERARSHGKFEVELVNLKEINLPMIDEPNHPVKRQYQHEHTKAWSAKVSAADAFVLVTPEYNAGVAPALVNALDYLFVEWNYKPAAFVSYGGPSGGTRSVQMMKPILTTLRIMPIPEGVAIPFVPKLIDEQGNFKPTDQLADASARMLDELLKWSNALATLRV